MIYLASDHAGWKTKEAIKKHLTKKGVDFEDLSSSKRDSKDDYPVFAKKVALAVKKKKDSTGILVCDSGAGMLIAANRVKGIRAVLLMNDWTTLRARKHEDANIAVFGEELQRPAKAIKLLNKFLGLKFSNKVRHKRRITMLDL